MYVCVNVCILYMYTCILRVRAVDKKIYEANAPKDLVIFWHNRIVYYHTDACTANVFHKKKKLNR